MFYRNPITKYLSQFKIYVRTDGFVSYDNVTFFRGIKFNSARKNRKPRCYYRLKSHAGFHDLLVHRLVAIAFCEKPSNSFNIVDHINGDSLLNAAYNLRWITSTLNNLNTFSRNTVQKYSKFFGQVKVNGKKHLTKSFKTEIENTIQI